MREQAGFTLDEAAPKLDKSRSVLHRIETGQTRVDVHLIRSIMDLYDIFDPRLTDQTREALKQPWYRAYGIKTSGYLDVETEAVQVEQFLLVNIPGLLQTEAYIRVLFLTDPGRSAQELDLLVRLRQVRQ